MGVLEGFNGQWSLHASRSFHCDGGDDGRPRRRRGEKVRWTHMRVRTPLVVWLLERTRQRSRVRTRSTASRPGGTLTVLQS